MHSRLSEEGDQEGGVGKPEGTEKFMDLRRYNIRSDYLCALFSESSGLLLSLKALRARRVGNRFVEQFPDFSAFLCVLCG